MFNTIEQSRDSRLRNYESRRRQEQQQSYGTESGDLSE
jgi:hypothetical protein